MPIVSWLNDNINESYSNNNSNKCVLQSCHKAIRDGNNNRLQRTLLNLLVCLRN